MILTLRLLAILGLFALSVLPFAMAADSKDQDQSAMQEAHPDEEEVDEDEENDGDD